MLASVLTAFEGRVVSSGLGWRALSAQPATSASAVLFGRDWAAQRAEPLPMKPTSSVDLNYIFLSSTRRSMHSGVLDDDWDQMLNPVFDIASLFL